jgi:hypothetical protein
VLPVILDDLGATWRKMLNRSHRLLILRPHLNESELSFLELSFLSFDPFGHGFEARSSDEFASASQRT